MMYQEISLTLSFPYLQEKWEVQNDNLDIATRFIYSCMTFDKLLQTIKLNGLGENTKNYAIHRWFNFICSKSCEEIFCSYGAIPCKNAKDNKVDFYIKDIPFDLKLTIKPQKLIFPNLDTRQGKDRLIKWFLANASKEQRNQNSNKIYLVVDNLWAKSNYEKINPKIKAFMDYYFCHTFNRTNNMIYELIYVN